MSENGGVLRPFHQASWNEPIVLEQSSPGERGILLPELEPATWPRPATGSPTFPLSCAARPAGAARSSRSRRCCGTSCASRRRRSASDVDIHLGPGTCTMKYSPKVNEELIRSHKVTDLHPEQDDATVQGMLEAM